MSIVNLHTIPQDTVLINDETFLCVFDDAGTLVADYGFCTGLRLLGSSEGLTIYVNDEDLASGVWTLFVAAVGEPGTVVKDQIVGRKDGAAAPRLLDEQPWTACVPASEITSAERQERLAICQSCPLFDAATFTCTAIDRSVLSLTAREDDYCPQELWGDKQAVLDARMAAADVAGGAEGTDAQVLYIDSGDQSSFEAELDAFLEGLT